MQKKAANSPLWLESNQQGTTLMELAIVVIVIGFLVPAIAGIINIQSKSLALVFNRTIITYEARNVMNELRSDLLKTCPDKVINISAGYLVFTKSDGGRVEYLAKNGDLLRNHKIVITGLEKDPFTYYDKNLQEISFPQKLKLISVFFLIQKNGQAVNLEEAIYVRN
ncbi:MAG: hypothetical protein K8R79_08735 [Calditrichales bacterium]|nr:hypothetical protein [Calditrichales bacterium]